MILVPAWRRTSTAFAAAVPADFYGSYLASAMDVRGRMDVATVLVIEQDERIVGTVTYFADAGDEGIPTRFPDQTAGLRATAVHPGAQGHGLGRSLVDACVERARLDGATSLCPPHCPVHALRCGPLPACWLPARRAVRFPGDNILPEQAKRRPDCDGVYQRPPMTPPIKAVLHAWEGLGWIGTTSGARLPVTRRDRQAACHGLTKTLRRLRHLRDV